MKLIVIGASAGGIRAIRTVVSVFPSGFPAATVIVQHIGTTGGSLSTVFQSSSKLPVLDAEDKGPIEEGRIYCAPGGYHLMIEGDSSFSLSVDDPVAYSRPSIDVLFETAAEAFKSSVIGVLLTGANHDGARGLLRIQKFGGQVVIQDPETAENSIMPSAGIALTQTPRIIKLEEIGPYLVQLVSH